MVYFISDGTYTKIGKSKNPLTRIKDLQTSNPNSLMFTYLFDCNDSFEKRLHKLLDEYKTKSNNEWFDLRNIDLCILSKVNHPLFKDLNKAAFKAKLLNNEYYRGSVHTSQARKEIIKHKDFNLKERRKSLIEEIKYILDHESKTIISYNQYIIKYGFTKNEISFFMRSCGLNKKIQQHNDLIFKNR